MSVPVKIFIKNRHVYVPILLTGMLFVISLFVAYMEFGDVQNRIVLHEDIQKQIDLTGSRGEVFLFMAAVAFVCAINAGLSRAAYARERFLSYLFLYVNIWLAVLFLLFIVSIGSFN